MNKKFIALVSSIAFALAPATTVLAEGDGQGSSPSADPASAPTPSAEPTAHTIHYETNGGTPIKDRGGVLGKGYDVFFLSDYKTEKEGYTFDGWYYDKDFTQPADNSLPTVNDSKGLLYFAKDITVYAKWKKNDEQPAESQQPTGSDPGEEGYNDASNTIVKSDSKAFVGTDGLGLKLPSVQNLIKKFNLENKKVVDAIDIFVKDQNATYSFTFSNKDVYKDGHVYKVHHFDDAGNVEKEAPTATAKNGSITVTLHGASHVLVEDLGVANHPVNPVTPVSGEEGYSDASNTVVKSDSKAFTGKKGLSLKLPSVQNLIKKFNLENKKIVDALEIHVKDQNATYSVTFSNKDVYKDGHVYKVHHFDDAGNVEKEAPTATAKNGSITVTLHGASPVLIEDLGVAATNETKVSGNGRKAALATGVEY